MERYRCAPGPEEGVESHAHEDEYQLCLAQGVACSYRYRGAEHLVPRGGLCVIHPGELHSTRDAEPRPPGATYRMLYLDLSVLCEAGEEAGARRLTEPFFPRAVFSDEGTVGAFRSFFRAVEGSADPLERESLRLEALLGLVERHAQNRPVPRTLAKARPEVSKAREFLHDNPGRAVSLEELSRVVGLSRYHLSRAFRDEFGLPPYAYHLRVRVGHSKTLLGLGVPPAVAAREAGFSDQSRFGRHFERIVGTTPGRYGGGKSKNRLYAER